MRIILFTLCLLSVYTAKAQFPPACSGTAPAIACDLACISCNFDGYSGSTYGFPTSIAPEFCGTVENAQWLGFIAGASSATFIITPSNCANGDGLQVALYSDCQKPPLSCQKGEKDGAGLPVSITVPIAVGGNYFLLIDGYAGDQCDFNVEVTPKEAVYEPPLELATVIDGPTELCPGSTFTFSTLPVAGAGAYIWSGPAGTLFDSMPSPFSISSSYQSVEVTMGNQSGPICVQAANACNVNPACTAMLDITVLGDDARPDLTVDTTASLTCTGAPLEIIAASDPVSNVQFSWTADSLGSIVSGANSLRLRVDSVGTYYLFARDITNGCTSRDSVRVTPQNYPSGANLTVQHITCYGLSNGAVAIDSVKNGTAPFLYALDDQAFMEIPNLAQLSPGEHTIAVQGIDGCEWDSVFTIIEPYELLVVLDPDISIPLGTPIVLWDSTKVNYPERIRQWILRGPAGDTLACAGCPVAPLQSFEYQLTVVDSNGCTATDQRIIAIEKKRELYIPNVFKPTIDESTNARFGVLCGDDVAEIRQFKIADRWGQIVFERSNDIPNTIEGTWDGRIANRLALPGVYVYQAEIVFVDGATKVFEGDITLIR